MRPGGHCKYCPARASCPAKDGELLLNAGALVRGVVSEGALTKQVDPGALHFFVKEMARLSERALAEIKASVQAGALYLRPDGKALVIRKKTVEGLSKASIVRALGKAKGERVISRLRKQGCCDVSEREELHAVDEKG
jgi:hypothetical protein